MEQACLTVSHLIGSPITRGGSAWVPSRSWRVIGLDLKAVEQAPQGAVEVAHREDAHHPTVLAHREDAQSRRQHHLRREKHVVRRRDRLD
jgi:hypothetical protein